MCLKGPGRGLGSKRMVDLVKEGIFRTRGVKIDASG